MHLQSINENPRIKGYTYTHRMIQEEKENNPLIIRMIRIKMEGKLIFYGSSYN
jgi:hypothetical protein